MSTKALKKELMAAVVMLLVAAIALSGSTFAWFAQNGKVTAENMQVTVKSDMGFLLITNGAVSAADVQKDNKTVVEALNTTAALYPTAPTGTAFYKYETYNSTAAGTAATNAWYFQYSTDPAVSTGVTTETAIDEPIATGTATFADYILLNDFSVTVAKDSVTMDALRLWADVDLGDNAGEATQSAVKVLVIVTSDGIDGNEEVYATFTSKGALIKDSSSTNKATSSAIGGTDENALLIGKIDDQSVFHIKVLIYWDGNDEAVFTNNLPNLGETKVSINIEGVPVPEN